MSDFPVSLLSYLYTPSSLAKVHGAMSVRARESPGFIGKSCWLSCMATMHEAERNSLGNNLVRGVFQ